MKDVLFTPSAAMREGSQLSQFVAQLSEKTGHSFPDYASLHRFSITHLETFWQQVWQFGDVQGDMGKQVLTQLTLPGAQWFPQATLNFTENLLHHGGPDQLALVAIDEQGEQQRYTYAQLHSCAMQLAAYLQQACQLQPGERVAAYMGNTAEAIIGMLATAYLGATWTSASPDFGLEGVLDRFGQIEPSVLIAGNGYRYGGKTIERTQIVKALRSQLPSVRKIIGVDVLPSADAIDNADDFHTIVHGNRPTPALQRFPFNQPLYILYSSGTTGQPKCIVHGAGGTLLQHIKELRLHGDIDANSRFFYFTTTGWMMWNWLASGLVTGATLYLYDGNPMQPTTDSLWEMATRYKLTHFGTSAKYLSACQKMGVQPPTHKLEALKVIFSTGSPLAPADFDWVYQQVKSDVLLHSISGGTDIVSCFVGGNPWLPVVKGKIQAANLGMAIEAWNDNGEPVTNQRGELVCTKPAPCMPIGFWNDPDNQRYHAAYFERFPGVWAHGDFCEIDEQGQVVILGRSDTTLNPGGVRIGTAEIYRQVETIADITDSLVVGRPIEGDIEVVLFVTLQDGAVLDDVRINDIKQRIRSNTTPRHVPKRIVQVAEIPYTRSGKKVELAVAQILRGEEPKNLTALSNPQALDEYKQWALDMQATDRASA